MTKRTRKPTGTDDKSSGETQMNVKKWNIKFPDDFVTDVCYGEGWRGLVDWLDEHREFLTFGMQNFVDNMMSRKRRPSVCQLATIVGLHTNIQLQITLDEREQAAQDRISREVQAAAAKRTEGTAENVVPLSRYKRRRG